MSEENTTVEKPDLAFVEVDPFDPANFAAPPLSEAMAVEKALTHCRVGSPPKDAFVRAHSDEEYSVHVYLLKLESTGETYLLMPTAAAPVIEMRMIRRARLTLAITRQGDPFLWVTMPPPEDGRDNTYWESGRLALEKAKKQWVRVQSNQSSKAYDVWTAKAEIPGPEWHERPLRDYIEIGFGASKVISKPDDEIIQRLLGLI